MTSDSNAITHIYNCRVLLADGREATRTVWLDNGRIAQIDTSDPDPATGWDAKNLLLLPGIVDLHGDAFERQIMPRAGTQFPLETALYESDKQMAANGITTAYYSVTYSWEPGLRSAASTRRLINVLQLLKPCLFVDSKIHLRFEVYTLEGEEEISEWLKNSEIDLLAFNDHIPHMMSKLENSSSLATYAERTGMTPDQFLTMLKAMAENKDKIPGLISRLAGIAKANAIPMASHDEERAETRTWYHELGCRICEFPTNKEPAFRATELGDPVVMGAPNVLNGKSLYNRLSARDAVVHGICDVLSSDYFYPSLLQAPFILVQNKILPLDKAWELVSRNPAQALGLIDRGTIAPGKRADLILVDDQNASCPQVHATFVEGEMVLSTRMQYRPCA